MGVRAEGARALDPSGGQARRNDTAWRRTAFHPWRQGLHHVECVGPFAAAAVPHPGCHEKADPLRVALRRAGRRYRLVIKIDARPRRNIRVAPAVVEEKLASMASERRQIRIDRGERPRGFRSDSCTSRSRSNVRQSHFGSLNTTYFAIKNPTGKVIKNVTISAATWPSKA